MQPILRTTSQGDWPNSHDVNGFLEFITGEKPASDGRVGPGATHHTEEYKTYKYWGRKNVYYRGGPQQGQEREG